MSRHDNYLDSRWSRRTRSGGHTRPHCEYHRLHSTPWHIRAAWTFLLFLVAAIVVLTVFESTLLP